MRRKRKEPWGRGWKKSNKMVFLSKPFYLLLRDLKNGGERRAHRKFELRERCIVMIPFSSPFEIHLSS